MIARVKLTCKEQWDEIVRTHQPVVVVEAQNNLPANNWTTKSLARYFPHRKVSVVKQLGDQVLWDPKAGLPIKKANFEDFLIQKEYGELVYLQEDVGYLPELREDYDLNAVWSELSIVREKFWVSGAGLVTPLHYDAVETLHWVVKGSKKFILYPPGVGNYYPYPANSTAPFISRINPDYPDVLKYPKFSEAQPIALELKEGEVLYLPAFWWHHVRSLGETNISLNFVWFASAWKNLRFVGQFARAAKHLWIQWNKARKARGG